MFSLHMLKYTFDILTALQSLCQWVVYNVLKLCLLSVVLTKRMHCSVNDDKFVPY